MLWTTSPTTRVTLLTTFAAVPTGLRATAAFLRGAVRFGAARLTAAPRRAAVLRAAGFRVAVLRVAVLRAAGRRDDFAFAPARRFAVVFFAAERRFVAFAAVRRAGAARLVARFVVFALPGFALEAVFFFRLVVAMSFPPRVWEAGASIARAARPSRLHPSP